MASTNRLILFIIAVLSGAAPRVHAQAPPSEGSAADSAGTRADSRLRVGAGVVSFIWLGNRDNSIFDHPVPYLNANYRISWSALPESEERTVGMSLEAGLNYILPYLAVGPEMRWGGFAVTTEVGAAVMLAAEGGAAAPFIGLGAGYITGTQGVGAEFSLGATMLFGESSVILPYGGVSVAFR